MPTEQILALLVAERDKLNRAIEALGGIVKRRRGRPPKNPLASIPVVAAMLAPATAKKHHMRSPAARKAQAARMKAYWAAKNKEKK